MPGRQPTPHASHPTNEPVHAESPSLRRDAHTADPAFEVKFLLTEAQAADVEAVLGARLSPDPHADLSRGGSYSITSLYCDTPRFDVYWRIGSHRSRKFRVRRYGASSHVFLERKLRRGTQVRKWRVMIDGQHLHRLNGPDIPGNADDWTGRSYRRQLLDRALSPVCAISYERRAFFGASEVGPVRLTFDRALSGALVDGWSFDPASDARPLLEGGVVCEFKFRGSLPVMFKSALETLRLAPRGVSKYRRCVEAFGLVTRPQSGPDIAEGGAHA